MITAIVQFKLPEPVTLDQARQAFLDVTPTFQQADGLIRKCFLFGEDGRTMGGSYLWRTREQAERFYNPGLRDMIRGRYGTEPTITYFTTPVVVDNLTSEVLTDTL